MKNKNKNVQPIDALWLVRGVMVAASMLFLSTYSIQSFARTDNFVTEGVAGCKVFNPGDPDFSDAAGSQAAWRGTCVDGKISGSGTLLTLHPQQKISCKHLVVEAKAGLLNGFTQTTCSNGFGMDIKYADGLPNGPGWLTKPGSGEKIEVEYDNGALIKRGTQTFEPPSKTKNQGVFQNDQRNGQSVQTLPSGEKRVGEFKDGEIIKGIATYPENPVTGKTKYEGDFQNGKPHGKGKFTHEFGSYYEGDFENGQYHGQGRLVYKDGDHKTGLFQNGKFVPGSGTEKDTLEARKEAEKERAIQQRLKNADAWNSSFRPYFPH